MRIAMGVVALVLGACHAPSPAISNAVAPPPPDSPGFGGSTIGRGVVDPSLPPAPWRDAISAGAVPIVYQQVWQAAENRDDCPLLVPGALGPAVNAMAEPTPFAGGWGIAYHQPSLCADCADSVAGVAGVGGHAASDADARWGKHVRWADGSHAGYGPIGDTGPGWLAYLVVEGSGCNYNVWSYLSEDHLLQLLNSLRRVQ